MRLRYVFLSLFLALTAVPLGIFWAWPHSRALQNELDDVQDRHLLLARNLGAALQRYQRDVSAVFDLLAANLTEGRPLGQAADILSNLGFLHICISDPATGRVTAAASPGRLPCPDRIPDERLDLFAGLTAEGRTAFSEVLAGADGRPLLFVVRRIADHLAIGSLGTDYFVRLGKAIAFGVKGHAVIVDHKGNVLAHPSDAWIAERRNLAALAPVARMLNGETGIATFYSPAMQADMIAGFAVVPEVGWGVMIPQPLIELQERAAGIRTSALAVVLLGLAIAAACAFFVAVRFARPLERISDAAERIVRGDGQQEVAETAGRLVPLEFRRLQTSFNAMVRRLRDSMRSVDKLAFEDPLTCLPNRTCFRRQVDQAIEQLAAADAGGAMIFFDIDGFKEVNNRLGHDFGDELLCRFARRIGTVLRQACRMQERGSDPLAPAETPRCTPSLARIGGDEFAIFLPQTARREVQGIAEHLIAAASWPFELGHEEAVIGASFGIALMPNDGTDYQTLLRRADRAMYEAKRSGKSTFVFFDRSLDDAAMTTERLVQEIHLGIARGEFRLQFQPRFDASTRSISSFEALVRWAHPSRGWLLPDEFLPAIETNDAIVALDCWVLDAALDQLCAWHKDHPRLGISINMSSRQVRSPSRAEAIIERVRRAGIDPSRVEFELTEHTVLSNGVLAERFIQALRDAGLKIALDDFGQGYSNFARLIDLPVDVIKIDRSLTVKLAEDSRVPSIVRSLIAMARGLGCHVVAEGVETLEQVMILSAAGCGEFQGYLFARPMSAAAASAWLRRTTMLLPNEGVEASPPLAATGLAAAG